MTNASTAHSREPVDTNHTQRSAAEGTTAGSEQADARPPLFPADGQFRPVIPLSEIDEVRAAEESKPPEESAGAEVVYPATGGRDDEQDETTLVPSRVSHAIPPRRSPVLRPKGVRQSWLVPAFALALSVIAGLIAGTYLIGSRQYVETLRPAPQPYDTSAPARTETVAASDTPVTVADEAEAKDKVLSANESTPKFAPRTTAPASRHASGDEPPDRSAMTAEARIERSNRTAGATKNTSPATKFARRDTAQNHRARFKEEPSPNSAPPEHSLPISSPPPSAKSRKVIQWP